MLVKNFLSKNHFKQLKEEMESAEFPWYFQQSVVLPPPVPDTHFQFTHTFYHNGMWSSKSRWILDPVLDKIRPMSILRIKANLNPRESKHIEHGLHADFKSDNAKITTAIFYVNTNNGYTLFEDGEKVKSIANSWYEFPSSRLHTGSSCTDEKKRIVINFNYIKA